MRKLAVACLVALSAGAPAHAVEDVPAGKTLVVVGQSGIERADVFAAETGFEPAGAMWYAGLYEEPEAFQAILDQIDAAVASHPGLVVDLGVSFGAISTPSPSYGAAIAAGAFDDRIAMLAEHLKKLPAVAYLRLGYEFDLLGGQYGPPEVYKAAYRHVVDELREAGVSNAFYVWHSAGAFWRATDPSFFAVGTGTLAEAVSEGPQEIDPQPIAAFYPGDEYVDSFGISYWQDSCCFGRSGERARAVYEKRTREMLDEAREMGLPLRISESTPVYVGADSEEESVEWLDRTFALIEEYDIRAWNLISIDWQEGGFFAAPFWNGYWPDARIHHFPETRERFLAGVAGERYLERPAAPLEPTGFRAAAGAVRCQPEAARLRCDVRRVQGAPRPDCAPSKGRSVVIAATGRARRVCAERAITGPLPTLAAGETWDGLGVRCKARAARVKCRNESGHGAKLGRKRLVRF